MAATEQKNEEQQQGDQDRSDGQAESEESAEARSGGGGEESQGSEESQADDRDTAESQSDEGTKADSESESESEDEEGAEAEGKSESESESEDAEAEGEESEEDEEEPSVFEQGLRSESEDEERSDDDQSESQDEKSSRSEEKSEAGDEESETEEEEQAEAEGEEQSEAGDEQGEEPEGSEEKSEPEEETEDEDEEDEESEEDKGPSGADRGTRATTLAEMIATATSTQGGTALKFKTDEGEWEEISYSDLGENLKQVAKGLIALGIEHGDKLAIFSDTRADWTLCDLAAISIGAVVAPIYQTSSSDEARHVLSDSGARLCFCERSEMVETVQEVRDDCPDLEHLVVIEGDVDDTMSLNELTEKGDEVDNEQLNQRVEAVSPEDLFTIVYTSGTTGPPKGCLLTHGNYRANLEMLEETADWGEEPVVFLFLPLAHVFTRVLQMLAIDIGGTIAFWEQEKDKIVDNLQEIEPTHFAAVPRIFEKIYGRATAEADGVVKEKAFWKAVEVGRKVREHDERGEEPNPLLRETFEEADKRVLSKVRNLFGSNLQFAATGAAPVQKDMLEFFFACGVKVLEGYGATETSAVATMNRPDDFKFGTVGKALPATEVEISDEDGEILIRGPHVFHGYHGMEEETKEDLDEDGWYHTGDVGELDDDGFLSITGRKKDIIVTSSGKNIASGYIENKIAASRWVSHAVVYGDDKPYLVALVTLDQDERDALLKEAGTSDGDDVAGDESVRDEVQKAIDAANDDLARVEQIKKFTIVDRELSQEEGEITPTMKVKRNVVYENFEDEFEALYDDDEGGD
jgi:long-chain acyl-CoA synthetase